VVPLSRGCVGILTIGTLQTSVPIERQLSRIPPAFLGHSLGAIPAPGGTALFCFGYAALRVTVSTFGGPSVNAELGTHYERTPPTPYVQEE